MHGEQKMSVHKNQTVHSLCTQAMAQEQMQRIEHGTSAAAGGLLSRAAHVVVAGPVVGLEVRVFRFELEGARLGLERASLLIKRGSLLAIQSLRQRHLRNDLICRQKSEEQMDGRSCGQVGEGDNNTVVSNQVSRRHRWL